MRIILAAYYGYFYGNYKDIRYALATQSIIWKEILGTYPVFSTELWEKGTILDLSFFISNIEKKINDNNKLPNLVPNKEIVVGNVVMFRDTNNVINSYDYSEYTNSGTLINEPSIYFPEAGIHTFKLNRNRYYDHNYRIYVDSDKQKLIMPGNIPELDYEFSVDVKPLNVHFEFKDSETNEKINGVKLKFNGELLNDNDTYTINRYTICTIQFESVPDKYELDTSIKNFDNYSSSDITLNFKLKPVYNYFTINKTYDDIYPEEDAIFELINNENNKLQGVYVTDSNGSFKMHIKYGTYTLNQLKGIQGYTLITETINNTHPNISGNEYTINLNDKRLENKSDIIQDSFTITPENTEILDNNQVDNIDDYPYTLELVSTGNNISLLFPHSLGR